MKLTGTVTAEYFGGPHDGEREELAARHCEAPDCEIVTAPAFVALVPGDGLERDEAGGWRPTKGYLGVYHLRHPEPIGGAYQYEWREGDERTVVD